MTTKVAVKSKLIQIGNSKGIRIPKALLEQSGIEGEVWLWAESDRIVLERISNPREGWAEAFKRMHQNGDDVLEDDTMGLSSFDEDEWE